ncbi:unnamed protein product, partial [Mesorhabditis spiculigera]
MTEIDPGPITLREEERSSLHRSVDPSVAIDDKHVTTRRKVVYDFDYEDPRLRMEGFVVDYFSWRIAEGGGDWYDQPEQGETQPEYKIVRKVCEIFERRFQEEIRRCAAPLIESPSQTFQKYCTVVEKFINTANQSDGVMSYGRLIGLLAFSGYLAAMLANTGHRHEISQVSLYTSKYIQSRINATWADEHLSWADFMETSKASLLEREAQQNSDGHLARWGIVAAAVVGVMVSVSLLLNKRH